MPPAASFKRTVNLKTAIALVVGTIIGSGIFMRPAEMAALLGSPLQVFGVWIVAGLFTMLSVMVLAEVAAMIPEDGGPYAFMRHMYGDFWAYLFGWAAFAVVNCAGTAAIAFIASQYAEYFFTLPRFSEATALSVVWHIPMVGSIFPLQNFGVKMLTIFVLCVFTFISYRSTKISGNIQVVFTAIKIIGIVLLVGGLFFSGSGSFHNFVNSSSAIHPTGFALVAALVAASNGALQAFDGCNNMLNIAGEIKDPGKNIPRSLFLGLGICILVYLAINAALFYVLPVDIMAGSSLVASDAAKLAFGAVGGGLIALLICLSVLGTTNSNVFTSPRLSFAMANQGAFFKMAGNVHPFFHTPANALLLHLALMIIMVLSGSFFILADMYIFIVWVFNLMLMFGVFILRKKMPYAERPYKVWGYPWVPILVIIFNSFYLIITLIDDIQNYLEGKTVLMNSVFGLLITICGIPLYWYFKRTKRSAIKIVPD